MFPEKTTERCCLERRIANYQQKHPSYSPLIIHNDRIYGLWLIGSASDEPKFYGSYPPGYLSRVRSLFPECRKVLHLFSGTLKGDGVNEITYDLNPELKPDICDDVYNLWEHFNSPQFDLILADPPYEARDFREYGAKPFNKGRVVSECAAIVKPGCFLVWLDTILPPFSKRDWELYGIIGLVQSTNHRIRAISIFQKGRPKDDG